MVLWCTVLSTLQIPAQTVAPLQNPPAIPVKPAADDDAVFRVEKKTIAGGSELVTIFAREAVGENMVGPPSELPLVSVLRDTLGDERVENDRLRYVWMHTFTRPSVAQKIASVIPFLYTRTTNKGSVGTAPPPPVITMNGSRNGMLRDMVWMVVKQILIAELGVGIKAPLSQWGQNKTNYKRSAIAAALTVLSLYQDTEGEQVLTDTELGDIRARLSLSGTFLGGHMKSEYLGRVAEKKSSQEIDIRGHNWELLRQYGEAEGLYFDPIEMSDGVARHAILWTTTADIAAKRTRDFNSRFLNIKNPWTDKRLADWKGYTQERWLDSENRPAAPGAPGATAKTMIPLAVYGLDHPKIPILLVDFRDNANPKMREMSRRVLDDIAKNIFSLSIWTSFTYFLGRYVYDFITGRRAMDINQTSRVRAYSQLKLLLSLDASLEPEFRNEIGRRIESATLNPLENDAKVEARLARTQYQNLMAYAERPDGLAAKVERDRREEMMKLVHGSKKRAWFALAGALSFGLYTHREKSTPELLAGIDSSRQLGYHERVIRETAYASAGPEIDANVPALKRSLAYIGDSGVKAGAKTTRGIAKIFSMTQQDELRSLCLAALYKANNSTAKKELLKIYNNARVEARWRDICAGYLKRALEEGQRISVRDAEMITGINAN